MIVGRRATGTWASASAHAGYRLDGAFFFSRSTPFSRGVRDIVAWLDSLAYDRAYQATSME